MTQELQETKSKFSEDKKQIFTLPNILTYIRILLVPVLIVLFIKGYMITSLIVFCIASLTDILDGKIARKFNIVSDIGKALDPLADKLLQVTVIILLTVSGRIHWIFPTLIFLKEMYMVVGGIFLVRKNIIAQANVWGKVAATLLAIGIILAFFEGLMLLLASIVLTAGIVFTYYAAYQYTLFSVKAYKKYLEQGNKDRIYLDYNKK